MTLMMTNLGVKPCELNAAALRCQGNDLLDRDGTISGYPCFQVIETAKVISSWSGFNQGPSILGELCCIDLQPLARMGDQHLCSHPETSPMEDYAALSDRPEGGGRGGEIRKFKRSSSADQFAKCQLGFTPMTMSMRGWTLLSRAPNGKKS